MFRSQILDNYSIELYPQYLTITSNYRSLKLGTQLYIDRVTEKINEIGILDEAQNFGVAYETIQASSILGIFEGRLQSYLLICKKCELVAQVLHQKYYRIQSVNFIGLKFLLDKKDHHEEYQLMQQLREFLSNNFYFSLFGNPCHTLQNIVKYRHDFVEFCWNSHLLQKLIDTGIQPQWYSRLIQGYVTQTQTNIEGVQIKYVLISRKCKHQSGTRFHHRGINDDGYVANFVMTENIIFIEDLGLSVVTYRGSVPTFWKQQSVQKKVKITRDQNLCNHAFIKHFHDLQQNYRNIHCVNLMGDSSSETTLNDAFRNLVDANTIAGVTLERIDFHKICRNGNPKQLDTYIRAVDEESSCFDCFSFNVKTTEIYSLQLGVYRINCLDCLDRTNTYQCRLSLRIIDIILKKRNIPIKLDLLLMIEDTKYTEFLNQYREAWAENGNSISQLYCGTNATTSEFTKQGKKTIKGFIAHRYASLTRLFNQQFMDEAKNITIQTYLQGVQTQKSQLDIFLSTQQKSYCKFQKLKLYTVTWNVNSKMIENLGQDVLKFENEFTPDIIVIGLQEIIKLNAQNVISDHQDKIVKWQKIIEGDLYRTGQQYQLIQSNNLVGILLLIYVKKQLISTITNIDSEVIKTGFEGHVGNKGACLIRFQIYDTEISVCDCHLEAGNKKLKRRIESIQTIHEKAFQNKQKKLDQSDYTLFLGDMNFRSDMSQQDAFKLIDEYNLSLSLGNNRQAESSIIKLQQFDQAYIAKQTCQLIEYQEGGITFLPTYKLADRLTYDRSKQKYIPSYCDRIFIKTNEEQGYKLLQYRSIERYESDHQPVVAMFVVDVKTIDKAKEKTLIQEFNKKNKELEVEEAHLVQQKAQDKALVESTYEGKKSLTQQFKEFWK